MATRDEDLEMDGCVSTASNRFDAVKHDFLSRSAGKPKKMVKFDPDQCNSNSSSLGYFSGSSTYSSGTGSLSFKDEDLDDLTVRTNSMNLSSDETENVSRIPESENISLDEGIDIVNSILSSDSLPSNELKDYQNISRLPRNLSEADRATNEALQVFGRDEDGDNLLHIAIIQGDIKHCFAFIQMAPGQDWLNMYNNELHQTALHLAAITDQSLVARRLMIGGAYLEMRDHNGDTPLHIACREGYFKMALNLLKPVSKNEELINEYNVKYVPVPQNLQLRNCEGYTCLHEAVLNKKYDIVLMLLENGADVNVKDGKQGATVLHYAAMNGDEMLAAYLVKHREINLNSPTYCGTTPAQIAYLKKNKVYDILVRAGAKKVTDADVQPLSSESSDEDDYMD